MAAMLLSGICTVPVLGEGSGPIKVHGTIMWEEDFEGETPEGITFYGSEENASYPLTGEVVADGGRKVLYVPGRGDDWFASALFGPEFSDGVVEMDYRMIEHVNGKMAPFGLYARANVNDASAPLERAVAPKGYLGLWVRRAGWQVAGDKKIFVPSDTENATVMEDQLALAFGDSNGIKVGDFYVPTISGETLGTPIASDDMTGYQTLSMTLDGEAINLRMFSEAGEQLGNTISNTATNLAKSAAGVTVQPAPAAAGKLAFTARDFSAYVDAIRVYEIAELPGLSASLAKKEAQVGEPNTITVEGLSLSSPDLQLVYDKSALKVEGNTVTALKPDNHEITVQVTDVVTDEVHSKTLSFYAPPPGGERVYVENVSFTDKYGCPLVSGMTAGRMVISALNNTSEALPVSMILAGYDEGVLQSATIKQAVLPARDSVQLECGPLDMPAGLAQPEVKGFLWDNALRPLSGTFAPEPVSQSPYILNWDFENLETTATLEELAAVLGLANGGSTLKPGAWSVQESGDGKTLLFDKGTEKGGNDFFEVPFNPPVDGVVNISIRYRKGLSGEGYIFLDGASARIGKMVFRGGKQLSWTDQDIVDIENEPDGWHYLNIKLDFNEHELTAWLDGAAEPIFNPQAFEKNVEEAVLKSLLLGLTDGQVGTFEVDHFRIWKD